MKRRHALLIVDDEVDVLESLRHQFHRAYRVLAASNAHEALELMASHEVHLILSDQRMPGMSGDAFLAEARKREPDAIRMLFTGFADIQAVINAVNEGHIFRYILKPWDAVELESVIREAAEKYDLLAERKALIAELRDANARLTAANEDLSRVDRLKTAFIEVASHEFNTPITLVMGLTELLRLSSGGRPDEETEILRQIAASGRQLSRLVTNMLTLLRAEDFRRALAPRAVDLPELIAGVVDQVRPFLTARGLNLTLEVADGLGAFEIDADKIAAVLVNLMTNAIKFTPDRGEVALKARADGDDWGEIRVEDRGVGTHQESCQHLFQPFFTQLDPSCHSSGDFGFQKRGLGLGLCIARRFVEMHGGGVRAERPPEGGTRMTIRLPRRPAATERGLDPPGVRAEPWTSF